MKQDQTKARTKAIQKRSRWPGWIWAIPIAAVGIVGWLAIRAFVENGASAEVTFENAASMDSDADVRYRGLKIGEVSDLKLAADGKHVVVTLSLHKDIKKFLRRGTRFWIVGASPGLTRLSSFKAMVTGTYIQMDPGDGPSEKHFIGLSSPPVVMSDTKGTEYKLDAQKMGSLQKNTAINYFGLQVGAVTHVDLDKDGRGFVVTVFVQEPYDRLVHSSSRFWSVSPISFSMNGGGIDANFSSLDAIASGAVSFETPDVLTSSNMAAADTHFVLYSGKSAAEEAPEGPTVRYVTRLEGAVGDLKPGAPIKMRGFRIGQVIDTRLAYNMSLHRLETPVTLEIEPARLGLRDTASANNDWRTISDDAMGYLIGQNLRAQLTHDPPVIGSANITLAFEPGAKPATLVGGEIYPEIPSTAAGDISSIGTQVSDVVQKIQNLPLDQIAEDVRATAEHLRQISSSPQISQSIDHLDHTLANVEHETAAARGKIGPLVKNLNRTADEAQSTVAAVQRMLVRSDAPQDQSIPVALAELTRTARAVRELADYLDRHPEALLNGRSGEE